MVADTEEFRQLVALHGRGVLQAADKLLNGLAYSDEYLRLTIRDVNSAIKIMRETSDELAGLVASIDLEKDPG